MQLLTAGHGSALTFFLLASLGGCHDSLTAVVRKADGGADGGGCSSPRAFTAVGSMARARDCQTASLLVGGKVLVAGGAMEAEIFDPATATFALAGATSTYRCEHTATVLDDGAVLIAGGRETVSAEVFDPSSASFVVVGDVGSTGGVSSKPLQERYGHTGTRLADGRVLIAGGGYGMPGLGASDNSAVLYDPATGAFTPTGKMGAPRVYHSATLLRDGRVLVVGGADSARIQASAELYDASTGAFVATGSLGDGRLGHTATLLADGRVLVAGGQGTRGVALSSAEIYDPASGAFSGAASLGSGRRTHTATTLCDGTLLLVGGIDSAQSILATTELYDLVSGVFRPGADLTARRTSHAATALLDGKVLVVGGDTMIGDSTQPLASAESYE
jgi:hypothetical protein